VSAPNIALGGAAVTYPGAVEIEKVSSDVNEIEVTDARASVPQTVITDGKGDLVPAAPYGNIFSPRETPYIFRLAPGEEFIHNDSLLGLFRGAAVAWGLLRSVPCMNTMG